LAGSAADPPTHAELGARLAWLRARKFDAPARAQLLAEQSPIYAGLVTLEAERFRANVFESFAADGLPEDAVPAALEELSTGDNLVSVAAAARSLMFSRVAPPQIDILLSRAIERFATRDVPFDLDPCRPSAASALGAIAEARAALRRRSDAIPRPQGEAGNAESCCNGAEPFDPTKLGSTTETPRTVFGAWPCPVEDQHGREATIGEIFAGRPAFVTFFYTRCMSPEKCSASIARMGRLQRSIKASPALEDAVLAGLTYDPAFDIAPRLLRYGEDRGLDFSGPVKLLRTTGSFESIRAIFELRVGFGETTVNRHGLEAFVLDRNSCIIRGFRRRPWTEEEVLSALQQAAVRRRGAGVLTAVDDVL
jgi:cytochrome oxidase Cu insertion factor (SCO1/SenC/PrrC family)